MNIDDMTNANDAAANEVAEQKKAPETSSTNANTDNSLFLPDLLKLITSFNNKTGNGNGAIGDDEPPHEDDDHPRKRAKRCHQSESEDVDVLSNASSLSPVPCPASVSEISQPPQQTQMPLYPLPELSPNSPEGDSPKVLADCVVCGDKSSGKHYGQFTCEGCKSFFKRSVRRNLVYACRGQRNCIIDQHHRNQCQYCRFRKCIDSGMKKEAVQKGRSGNANLSTSPFGQLFVGNPFLGENQLAQLQQHLVMFYQAKALQQQQQQQQQQHQNAHFSVASLHPPPPQQQAPPLSLQNPSSNGHFLNILMQAEQKVSVFGGHYSQHAPVAGLNGIQEVAARLLFIAVDWAKSVLGNAIFSSLLSSEDIASLLRNSWADLWIISASQWPWAQSAFAHLVSVIGNNTDDNNATPDDNGNKSGSNKAPVGADHNAVVDQIQHICRQVDKLRAFELDATEYTCLKALVLFSSDLSTLANANLVEALQERVTLALEEYIRLKSNQNIAANRLPLLLLRVNTLRTSNKSCSIERLFFARLVGNVSIESLIDDMLMSKNTAISSHLQMQDSNITSHLLTTNVVKDFSQQLLAASLNNSLNG